MVKLENIVRLFNEFQCSAIEQEYNTNSKVQLKPVAEELKQAIDRYLKELEDEVSNQQKDRQ
mgnify:CR=1 FL=1